MYIQINVFGQSVTNKELVSIIGNWYGKLIYLDYTTSKPYTMLVNVKISISKDNKGFDLEYLYPNEKNANSIQSLTIIDNNFGNEEIVNFRRLLNGGFVLITEVQGKDGNDDRLATLRHTYIKKVNTFNIIKEVRFKESQDWIKRNEYILLNHP
jgi:hypothetical protein